MVITIEIRIRKLNEEYELIKEEGELFSKEDLYIYFNILFDRKEIVGTRELEEKEKELGEGAINIQILEEDLPILTEII